MIEKKLQNTFYTVLNKDESIKDTQYLKKKIADFVNESDFVIVTAEISDDSISQTTLMVAKTSRELGCKLIIGVISKPSFSENEKSLKQVNEEIKQLKEYVDTLIIVSNDKFLKANEELREPSYIENLLRYTIQGIIEMVTVPGLICMDFFDLYVVTKNKGSSLIGVGKGKGQNNRKDAFKEALDNLLLESKLDMIKDMLIFSIGSKEANFNPSYSFLSLVVNEGKEIRNSLGDESTILYSIIYDDLPDDELIYLIVGIGIEDI